MKRRDFFKWLGAGIGGVVVAPLVAQVPNTPQRLGPLGVKARQSAHRGKQWAPGELEALLQKKLRESNEAMGRFLQEPLYAHSGKTCVWTNASGDGKMDNLENWQ